MEEKKIKESSENVQAYLPLSLSDNILVSHKSQALQRHSKRRGEGDGHTEKREESQHDRTHTHSPRHRCMSARTGRTRSDPGQVSVGEGGGQEAGQSKTNKQTRGRSEENLLGQHATKKR